MLGEKPGLIVFYGSKCQKKSCIVRFVQYRSDHDIPFVPFCKWLFTRICWRCYSFNGEGSGSGGEARNSANRVKTTVSKSPHEFKFDVVLPALHGFLRVMLHTVLKLLMR